MKALRYIGVLVACIILSNQLCAQSNKSSKEAAIKKAIESRNYRFVAQYVQPLGGGQRYLNYDYDVRIRPDSVIAYLPYFGTVQFAPPYNPTDDGVKFTSTKYDYQVTVKKKNYIITINPKDAGYNRKLILTTSTTGYASLQVIITNRTPVFFTGYVTGINDDTNDDKGNVTANNAGKSR